MSGNLRLTEEQVQVYNTNGYLLPSEPVFSSNDFDRLKAIFEEDLVQFGAANLDVIHFRDARLLEFLLSDAVLDLIEPLIGPNLYFIAK